MLYATTQGRVTKRSESAFYLSEEAAKGRVSMGMGGS